MANHCRKQNGHPSSGTDNPRVVYVHDYDLRRERHLLALFLAVITKDALTPYTSEYLRRITEQLQSERKIHNEVAGRTGVKVRGKRWLPFLCLLLGLTSCGGGGSSECRSSGGDATTTTAQYVFVANYYDGSVSPYKLGTTGALTAGTTLKLSKTLPYDFTYDPKHQRLFALGPYSVSVLSVSNDGNITEMAGSPLWIGDSTPAPDALPSINAIAIHPSGDFLFVAEKGAISTYRVTATATPLTKASEVPYSASVLHYPGGALQIDPSGKYLYALSSGSDAQIGIFAIDTTTGALTPTSASPFRVGEDAGAMAMNPAGKILYVWYPSDTWKYVRGFSMDEATGALMPATGSPFPTVTYPGQMVFSGDFTFMLGGSEHQLTTYLVANNGALTYANSLDVSSMMMPAGMATDSTGKFFFLTNGYPDESDPNASTMFVYSIGANGTLTQAGSNVRTGLGPLAVLVVPITTSTPSTCVSTPGAPSGGRGH